MKVIVSRKWHKPEITAEIEKDGISLGMDADDFCTALQTELSGMDQADFCEALQAELGSITWTFSDVTFRTRLDAAIDKVLASMMFQVKLESAVDDIFDEMKKTSAKVI